MNRLVGLLVAVVLLAGVLVAGSVALPAVSASTTVAPSWASLQQSALRAAAGYSGNGPLAAAGPAGPVAHSTVTTSVGRITVAQRTVVATGRSGTVVLQLALLGGTQLVVDETNPAADYQGEALVLQPGSSAVASAYPLHGTAPVTANAATDRHRRGSTATEAVLRATRTSGHRATARLVTIVGCYPAPQTPGVIGSDYGPLVQGEAVVECYDYETLSLIGALYQGSTQVGTTVSGSGGGTIYGINIYFGCSIITGTNSFHTAELWGVNGVLQGGATSSSANLHCS